MVSSMTVGLQIPGMGKRKRDLALLDEAEKFASKGYRRLMPEVFDLGKPKGQNVRPGMAVIAPKLLAANKAFLRWWLDLRDETPGAFADAWADQLLAHRARYKRLRAAVRKVLGAQGKQTRSIAAANIGPPKGETVDDWLSSLSRQAIAPMGFVILGLGLAFALSRRK